MLRQESAPIRQRGEMLNLIGIDHGSELVPDAERQVEGDTGDCSGSKRW
jgi:hypothetical protein